MTALESRPTHIAPAAISATTLTKRSYSDRFLGGIILAFFLSLYLLTAGGHGYSPDGEFAWRIGRSITMDPDREYFNKMRRGLSQWGFMVPFLSQPLVVPGEIMAPHLPQKDYATVDGRTYIMGIFRQRGLTDGAPTAGPLGEGVRDIYYRDDFKVAPATSLGIVSFLALAKDVPQGTTVAEMTLFDAEGGTKVVPLRAGIETSEWSLGKMGSDASHSPARVASIWGGNTTGRNFYTEIPFDRPTQITAFRIQYMLPEGHLYVRAMGAINSETGGFEQIKGENRYWSERENDDLYSRFFFSLYNAFTTAAGCLLLFALARLLGYSQRVSLAATLVYGVSTMAWPYAKFDFSEPTLVMFVLASLYLILRWDKERRDRFLLAAGVTALLAVATKYASGILVPIMLLQLLLFHWDRHPRLSALPAAIKPLLLFCLPFIVVAVPAVALMSQSFGYWPSVLEAWAGVQRGWLPLPLSIGLSGLLFSPGKSFFLYSPPTVLALFSVFAFTKRHGVRSLAILVIIAAYFLIYSKKPAWHAGAGWGPRYQVLVLPLVVLVSAPFIEKALEARRHWARYLLLATFLLGIGVQLLGVSKSFDNYLGIFRHQVVKQLPDQGAQYGGAEYYPYSAGLDDGNTITATMLAWPFSPMLAHGWLLAADFASMGPSFLQPTKDKLLVNPPWKLFWGIDAVPEHPEYGLGFDFWSMRMWTDFPSFYLFRAVIALIVLALQATVLVAGARIIAFLLQDSAYRSRAVRGWIGVAALAFLVFNGIHFLL